MSQGLPGACTPHVGFVLRADPEAQLSWDRTVAVRWHPGSSLPPSGSTWEQKLSLYHKNVSAWSTAHAQQGWWANECVLIECRGCDPRVSFSLKKKKHELKN